MAGTTDFLMTVQGMTKLHDGMIKMVCGKYQLTLIEGKIISFCTIIRERYGRGHCGAGRRLSKGNVSSCSGKSDPESILECVCSGIFPTGMMVKELKPGVLDGRTWYYRESPAFEIDMDKFEEFDRMFEPKEKKVQPSQEAFYIISNSTLN
mgnify:CR=1 FL=1